MFIKLKQTDGKALVINTEGVRRVVEDEKGALIQFHDGDGVFVKESLEGFIKILISSGTNMGNLLWEENVQ